MTATTSTKASVSANDIDPEQAKRFKLAIVGKPAMTAHLFSDDPELKPKPRILHDTFKELRSELVAANTKERLDVGMTVNRTDGEGRKKENIVEIQCLFLDVDEGTAEPRTFPLQPHLIVNPSPGRYHYYFLVHDCPLDGYEKKLLLLAARYGGDTTDATTERVMRMPGFLNHQYDPPYLVNIVQDNSDVPRYGLDEFKSKMGLNAPQTGLTVFNAHDGESAPEMPSRDRLQKALAAIRTDDYTTCRSVLMALKSVEAKGCSFAKDLAREYSRRSSEHCGRQFDRVWDGFKPRERKILTEETIWYLARKFGYVDSENQPLLQAGEDIDNARMLTEYLARSGFRYLYESKQWVQFNGMGWVKCNDSKPFTAATECFQSIRELAVSATSKAQVKATARLGSGSGIRAAFDIGRRHSRIELSVTDFDRDRLLLGVTNGVLDMASKQLIVPTPELCVMRRVRVAFDPDARCPRLYQFFKEVTKGDKALYRYIKKLLGYVLYGECNLGILPILYGEGRNGKGTLIDTMQGLFGDYATQVQAEVFMARRYGNGGNPGPTPELAQLPGIRFLNVTELGRGRRVNHELLKQISGEDTVNCRLVYGKPFVYKPMFTPFFVGNHRVEMDPDDEALWARIVVIPFDVTFEAEARDKDLRSKLESERPGILNWLLEGYELFMQEGLRPPKRVIEATMRYRYETDTLMRWREARCDTADEDALSPAGELFLDYVTWCRERQLANITDKLFKKRLTGLGYDQVKREKGHFFRGIALIG